MKPCENFIKEIQQAEGLDDEAAELLSKFFLEPLPFEKELVFGLRPGDFGRVVADVGRTLGLRV